MPLRVACLFVIVAISLGVGAQPLRGQDAGTHEHFDARISPLLAKHCVECHNPTAKKGGLDLSRKDAAVVGGKSGKVLTPGKAAESLLWKQIDSGKMPKDRPGLADRDKALLREWIDAGAVWSDKVIEPAALDTAVLASRVRRLTAAEYIATVRSTLGVDIERDARKLLPPDLRADGFSNTAYNLNVDLSHIEAYARLAEIIVGRVDASALAAQYSPQQDLSDDNFRKIIAGLGKWLLRGPLDDREVAAYLAVSQAVVKEKGGFAEAVKYVLEAMLQSPRFIYRMEQQRDNAARLDNYELAARLSYILWGGPPDQELYRAADAGELSDRGRVAAQVERMLADPRAIERSGQFISEWMHLDRLTTLQPNSKRFPQWNAAIAEDMRQETLAFFKHLAWEQKRPLAELFNAQVTFATPRLARHYGLQAAAGAGESTDERSSNGLELLYHFCEADGNTIRDSSPGGPLNLKLDSIDNIARSSAGIAFKAPVLILSEQPPKKLSESVQRSQAITLEAWITPHDTKQAGPARILTLSSGPNQRNFTIGQEGDKFEVRLRTSKTDGNGVPGLVSPAGSVQTKRTQVVFTREKSGKARLYIDGKEVASRDWPGDFNNWDPTFHFAVANETTRDRAWLGTLHQVAVYSRALTPEEIQASDIHPSSPQLAKYDLTASPARGGLLTHGSVLTIGGDEASMVTRGLFVLKELLYSGVEDPPPCVDTTPVPTKPGQSQRAIAMQRLGNQACAGCHSKFEPLAFALEKFDGVGAYHESDEHGNKLREDGEILFPDQEKPLAFASARELMNLLAGSERVKMAITRKATQYAIGRPLLASDEAALDKIHAAAQQGGGTYANLMTAIVLSDLVQKP